MPSPRRALTPPGRSRSGQARAISALLLALAGACASGSGAEAQGWVNLAPLGGPVGGNRQMGLIVDVTRGRLVMAGGENGDGNTWEMPLGGTNNTWVSLNAAVPEEARDVVRAIYDAANQRMLLIGYSMTVYSLDLTDPSAWTELATQGPLPPLRRYPGVTYDSRRGRMLVHGGLGGPGNDVWALDLSTTPPRWEPIVPSNAGPAPTWAGVSIYDPIRDQMVAATGTPESDDVWALSLDGVPAWSRLVIDGPPMPSRYLSAGVYDPASDAFVICAGHRGAGRDDIWSLSLSGVHMWTQLPAPSGAPPVRWSHAAAYWPQGGQLIMVGGWNSAWLSDVWAYQLATVTGPPILSGFQPRGGRIGDQVTLTGARLATPTAVSFGGVAAPILSSGFSLVVTEVPAGAQTGFVEVTTPEGTAVSPEPFFVGEPPVITSLDPDSARAGETLSIHGLNLLSTQQIRFNGVDAPGLVVESDELVRVLVPSLATSGLVQIVTLVGAASSPETFLVIPDDPRPRLLSVRDVDADQGGRVFLRWRASDFDQPKYRVIRGYRVWRQAPEGTPGAVLQPLASGMGSAEREPSAVATVFWEAIADLPAAFLPGYAFVAPTLRDSTEYGNPMTAFFVQALTADPFVFYNSSPDSGYSVDDLAPPAPAPLTVVYGASANELHWRGRALPDLHGYRLHRGTDVFFVPDASNLVATTTDTAYVDISGSHFYKLAAVDIHGNRSRFVAVSPDRPVAALASFYRAFREPGSIRVLWFSGGNVGLQATVYRRTGSSDWESQGSTYADGTGFLSFEDRTTDDGERYGYRIGILEGGEAEQFMGETWVEPLQVEFTIAGRIPNPSLGGRITCSVTLPTDARADLRLYDVSGREVARRVLEPSGGREHAVVFGDGTRLRAGVYVLRAVAGGVVMSRRVVVLD